MGWIQIVAYVLGWAVLLNTIWVTYLAVFKPEFFNQLNKHPGHRYLDGAGRAYIHIIGAFIGYYILFHIMFNLAFSFIPGNWGTVDEDGEFLATRIILASLASILMAALAWSAIGHAGDRFAKELAAKDKLDDTLQDLDLARKDRSDAIFEAERLREAGKNAELDASREKYRHENHINNLRSLIPPEVLEKQDRIEREQAAAGPRTFYS